VSALSVAPSPRVSTASRTLRLVDLLNDLDTLVDLLQKELEAGPSLNAFLLAAGIGQVTEDYLQSDRGLLLKVAGHLALSGSRIMRLGSGAVRMAEVARSALRAAWTGDARVEAWLEDVESLVELLAANVMDASAPEREAIAAVLARLLAAYPTLPHGLRRSLIRLPSCFRSFDQHPDDMARLASRYAETAGRGAPAVVVGVRTSGSYLAPLVAARLRMQGFRQVASTTFRPGIPLRSSQRKLLRRLRSAGGVALVVDDPPTTGGSLRSAARALRRYGLRGDAVVLLVALPAGGSGLPAAIEGERCIVLRWEDWSIHDRLAPERVRDAMAELLGERWHVAAAERVGFEATERRRHATARYCVKVIDRAGRKTTELDVHASGVGVGYFGEHSLEIAGRMGSYAPRIHGLADGVLLREWLPSSRRLGRAVAAAEPRAARAAVEYVLARHKEMRVPRDTSLRLRGRLPAWEATSNLLSQSFGRAWAWFRIPLVDPLVEKLLRVKEPSVVDGSMAPAHWFAGVGQPRRTIKLDADRRAFANVDLASYDPVFDVAGLSADAELEADETSRAGRRDAYRDMYETATGSNVSAERWFLLQTLHLWDRLRLGEGGESSLRRAMSRAAQRYYAEVFLEGIAIPAAGPLVALDVDGVLEGQAIGVPALTRSSALSLRALLRHGFRPVLMTGRSLAEVRDRCATLGLAGGVAEYGSVVYDHARGTVTSMLSEHRLRNVARAREAVARLQGVAVDADYRYSVRAFAVGAAGRRRTPDLAAIEQALRGAGLAASVELIPGDAQVDIVAVDVAKGTALAELTRRLGAGADGIALAVGDGPRDVSAFGLARIAVAPAHAPAAVRAAAERKTSQAYQRGLAEAVRMLIGHRPGACATCRPPRMTSDRDALIALLSAQERGVRSMAAVALALELRNLLDRARR
jgi:hydroxymethylpyrimidine pyrophosphatase-like HAD family hydrolase/adenine/guanine phosphoribosyltransferase-like PRPP-binding protein